jgi:hypothetical protein
MTGFRFAIILRTLPTACRFKVQQVPSGRMKRRAGIYALNVDDTIRIHGIRTPSMVLVQLMLLLAGCTNPPRLLINLTALPA